MPKKKKLKKCSCGRIIKQKYFKKCIHCQKEEKRRKKELRRLRWTLRATQGPTSNPVLDYVKKKI